VYAIIEDSGQQFRVSQGDTLDVDVRDLPAGAKEITFDRVLLVSAEDDVKVGTPLVEGAKVLAEVVEQEVKGPKLYVYKFRRRKTTRRKTGHRQRFLRVRVTKIVA